MKLKYSLVGLLCLLFMNGCASGRIKLDASTNKLCLKVLREGLRSDEFWPSIHAAEGLTLGGYGREVRAHLEPKLKTEKDDQHRCGLARELVRAGDKDKLKIMIGILEGEKDHGHVHAAESLYKVGGAGKTKPMRAAFSQNKNIRLRLMAAAAMAKAGDAKAMAFLRERMRNEKDPKLYTVAAWILGRIGAKSDIALIRSRLGNASDALSKAYLNHAMAALGDPQGQAALTSNMGSDAPGIRVFAAVFASDAGMGEVKPQLIKLLRDDTLDVRIRAAQSLLVLSR